MHKKCAWGEDASVASTSIQAAASNNGGDNNDNNGTAGSADQQVSRETVVPQPHTSKYQWATHSDIPPSPTHPTKSTASSFETQKHQGPPMEPLLANREPNVFDSNNNQNQDENGKELIKLSAQKVPGTPVEINGDGGEGNGDTNSLLPFSKLLQDKCSSLKVPVPNSNAERMKFLRDIVEMAIKNHKVFSINGNYNSVRHAMKKRGWVERVNILLNTKPGRSKAPSSKTSRPSSPDEESISDVVTVPSTPCSKEDVRTPTTEWLDNLKDYTGGLTELESDASLISRLLRCVDAPADFYWTVRRDSINWRMIARDVLVNRFPNATFTTKRCPQKYRLDLRQQPSLTAGMGLTPGLLQGIGLCQSLQTNQWFQEAEVARTLFPRCYILCHEEDRSAFIEDFRTTACFSLLQWLVSKSKCDLSRNFTGPDFETMPSTVEELLSQKKKEEPATPPSQESLTTLGAPASAFEFAIQHCKDYVTFCLHEDIDTWDTKEPQEVEREWAEFTEWYYHIVHENKNIRYIPNAALRQLIVKAAEVLANASKFWSTLEMDGMDNVWIIKPGAKSRGRGIIITNKLDRILQFARAAPGHDNRYVVQKYIERPLLIFNTKFDIRQWFLVTDWNPLTIWMYRESYLRFCSKTFSLVDMHESIHLCNNAVQKHYINGERNNLLPEENMWDCYTFQAYLKGAGYRNVWYDTIYPGMREGIVGTLLASQDGVNNRKNSFELFGADFMLTEDFKPWLIEINSCPCMSPSTSVTARMCANCLEDIIKVVIDRKEDKVCNTGMFEMVYKQHQAPLQPYTGIDLQVIGNGINKRYFSMVSHIPEIPGLLPLPDMPINVAALEKVAGKEAKAMEIAGKVEKVHRPLKSSRSLQIHGSNACIKPPKIKTKKDAAGETSEKGDRAGKHERKGCKCDKSGKSEKGKKDEEVTIEWVIGKDEKPKRVKPKMVPTVSEKPAKFLPRSTLKCERPWDILSKKDAQKEKMLLDQLEEQCEKSIAECSQTLAEHHRKIISSQKTTGLASEDACNGLDACNEKPKHMSSKSLPKVNVCTGRPQRIEYAIKTKLIESLPEQSLHETVGPITQRMAICNAERLKRGLKNTMGGQRKDSTMELEVKSLASLKKLRNKRTDGTEQVHNDLQKCWTGWCRPYTSGQNSLPYMTSTQSEKGLIGKDITGGSYKSGSKRRLYLSDNISETGCSSTPFQYY